MSEKYAISDFSRRIAESYDKEKHFVTEFYEYSDFQNYGFWREDTTSTREACENLVEELLDFIREKKGNILDVGCGKGATTRHLLKYFKAQDVVGINISKEQLKKCKQEVPNGTFLEMDATNLDFSGNKFDNIICVEAAHHFDTRENFLKEAHRILKPKGNLVLADILMSRSLKRLQPVSYLPANCVGNLDDYRQVYRRAGFVDVKIVDATEHCIGGCRDATRRFLNRKRQRGEISPLFLLFYLADMEQVRKYQTYALVACTKR